MVAPAFIYYRFVVLSIEYLYGPYYVKVRIQTPFVCHLYLHYTQHPILKHPSSRTIRGIVVPWGVYFCFTGYKTVEQEEAGDTLTHTFHVPDWSECQTINMITTGTVAGVESPSCGPIISHHKGPGPFEMFEHYNIGDTGHYYTFDVYWRAQTFTPSIAHTITAVKLRLGKYGSPVAPLLVFIHATDPDGFPTGPGLCTGTLDTSILTTTPAWYEITLGTGTNLTASTKYAIVIACPGADDLNLPAWRLRTACFYPGGSCQTSSNSGSSWIAHLLQNFMFEEWGHYIE